ncbi:MAG: 30S ribosomal protein S8, partial [Candidatus Micrarchaeaceae archaeon]
KIKVCENIGSYDCVVPSTKLVKVVLETIKKNNYIDDFQEVTEGKFKVIKIKLSKKINDIGVIKPRHAVSTKEYQLYEKRYIPSRDFGFLILSTPKGIMTNKDAKNYNIGGRLLAYLY